MIVVRRGALGWHWTAGKMIRGCYYEYADHALRDAWLWAGRDTPALIYTGAP